MRQPAKGNIIQNVKVQVTAILTVTVETAPGADTNKILSSVGPEVLRLIRQIPFVAEVEAIDVREVVPPMRSTANH